MIYKYKPYIIPDPNETIIYYKTNDNFNEEDKPIEIAILNDWHYIFVPDEYDLPEQPEEIN